MKGGKVYNGKAVGKGEKKDIYLCDSEDGVGGTHCNLAPEGGGPGETIFEKE